MAMVVAMSVGGTRGLSSGAFFPSRVWSRGSEIRTRASVRASLPATKANIAENYKEAEIGGRELTHSSKRSRTICNVTADSANAEIESKEATGRCLSGPPLRGKPLPFGATVCEDGVNFAVHSSGASAVALCLFTESDLQEGRVTTELPLNPVFNRTGDVWHIFLPDLQSNLLYGYRVDGRYVLEEGACYDPRRILVDPYAKAVISRETYGTVGDDGNCWPQMAGMVPDLDDEFDWDGDFPPRIPQKDLVIYEMHVRGFTKHSSSEVDYPGTYIGLVEKLSYLKDLGINAIELMPSQEFNELEYHAFNPVMNDFKTNFWGYSTINFFSPMTRFAAAGTKNCGREAIKEFKTLVREAHKRGMEVLMDVVFNHTAEGNEMGPTISFRGFDNHVYYMTAPKGEFYNYSGCGNTFNCNHPIVRRFIIDCLRYWVTEMHVDGFRFDLASIMTRASSHPVIWWLLPGHSRLEDGFYSDGGVYDLAWKRALIIKSFELTWLFVGLWDKANVFGRSDELVGDTVTTGTPLNEPPLIDMISNDPVLRGVKLIAEAWDSGGLYQVGSFPHWGVWSEWNGQFRDAVRLFIKGTEGTAGLFAQCLCGSPHLYQEGGRKPWHSINFITAHDGFTLADLVSYNQKHNVANGEDNNDGENHNNSWNCGEEGEDVSIQVQRLRQRQLRNFFVALMVSQGVPMMTMGDEYGHSKGGNNNTYCHDNFINYFRWDKKREDPQGFHRFANLMINFRRGTDSLGLGEFPTGDRLEWHGISPHTPDWTESSKFVAFTLVDQHKRELYIAFNASHLPVVVTLPDRIGAKWYPLIDTSKPSPYDFLTEDLPNIDVALAQTSNFLNSSLYPMINYSAIVLVLKDENVF